METVMIFSLFVCALVCLFGLGALVCLFGLGAPISFTFILPGRPDADVSSEAAGQGARAGSAQGATDGGGLGRRSGDRAGARPLRLLRVTELPELARVVVGVDPPDANTDKSDECGIVVVGLGTDGDLYILADLSGPHTAEQ